MNADKLTKPVPGDHWINGLLLKILKDQQIFSMVFQIFTKTSALGPLPSTDKGTRQHKILINLFIITFYHYFCKL